MPQVSIIVPNYNHSRFLKQRLDSVFNQTFQDFEVILLDDCSTDNSVEILRDYSAREKVSHFIVNTQNSGSTFKQWSRGLELAKGQYIWIAESDDWSDFTFLEASISVLDKNPSLGFVYCQSIIIDSENNELHNNVVYTNDLDSKRWTENYFNKGVNEVEEYALKKNIIPNVSAVLFRANKLILPKNINRFSYMGDWYLYLNLMMDSDIYYIAAPLNYYREHAASVRVKAILDGRREQEFFYLLSFLKKTAKFASKLLAFHAKENTKRWYHKKKSISLKSHFKILISYIQYLLG